MADSKEYKDRFLELEAVRGYEKLYGESTRDSLIWRLQQPYLTSIIQGILQARGSIDALDFACGTGRILTFVEPFVNRIDAIDISPAMAEVARNRATKARVVVGDITQPDILARQYDVATAFRFLLNSSDEARHGALESLRERLLERRGYLIVNNHGNLHSLRHPVMKFGRKNTDLSNELRHSEVRDLLDRTGFKLIQYRGFGLFPDVAYRLPLGRALTRIDAITSARTLTTRFSIDIVYVAQAR